MDETIATTDFLKKDTVNGVIQEAGVISGIMALNDKNKLVYFKKANDDQMARRLVPINWEEVKSYFPNTFI